MGCHFLLQGIFLTQGSNSGLPHCRQTLYHLSNQGSLLLSWPALIQLICLTGVSLVAVTLYQSSSHMITSYTDSPQMHPSCKREVPSPQSTGLFPAIDHPAAQGPGEGGLEI